MPGEIPSAVGLATVSDPATEVRLRHSRMVVGSGKGDAAARANQGRLEEACQGFEAIFINMVLQEMRKTVPDDGLLPTSNATRIWRELFDNQLAETLASKQEMGLAKMLYQQLQGQVEGGKSGR